MLEGIQVGCESENQVRHFSLLLEGGLCVLRSSGPGLDKDCPVTSKG